MDPFRKSGAQSELNRLGLFRVRLFSLCLNNIYPHEQGTLCSTEGFFAGRPRASSKKSLQPYRAFISISGHLSRKRRVKNGRGAL